MSALVSLAKQSGVIAAWELDDVGQWDALIDHYDIMLKVKDSSDLDRSLRNEEDVRAQLIDEAIWCICWARDMGRELIDFDDMIWLPLVEGSPIEQYDWVLVDEAQDTNVTRRMLAEKMLKPGGRSVWVGDRNQAIYGFTGADADAVDLIAERFDCTLLPLSVTFRCAKKATKLAQQFVPHITAHEDNEEGTVEAVDVGQLMKRAEDGGVATGDAVLCRLTAPLVELAYDLIRNGVPAHVEGRDIGKGLENLATKWKSATTAAELSVKLNSYLKHESEKLIARGEEYKVESMGDRVSTLYVIMDGCDTVDEIVTKIRDLFKDSNGANFKGGQQYVVGSNTVTLSTVHKAKGREWEKVWILGWGEYMPSKWARQEWEMVQEDNLQYVAVTRAKRDLVLVSVPARS